MLKAVFFDLDGTLLPMNEDKFTKLYFKLLCEKVKPLGYEPNKLINCIWEGTKLMYQNDSGKTNEEVFWECFLKNYDENALQNKEVFDEFYLKEFYLAKDSCGTNPFAKDIITYAKKLVGKVILTTNPIFPYNGVKTRLDFINLAPEDFDYITTYENSYHCKPNPKYFKDVLDRFNLLPNEVILFGNNDQEDYLCAKLAGITCYLVGENLILHDNIKNEIPHIMMKDVVKIIDEEFKKRNNEK